MHVPDDPHKGYVPDVLAPHIPQPFTNFEASWSIYKHLSAKLLAGIEDLQWSALSESVFKHAYEF